MYYRCELLIGGMTYDATNELVNWDDVEMSFKRGDYDGVVRSFPQNLSLPTVLIRYC